jgi:hypothetical protein|tara:strand:+ start:3826 stop:5205 length:1380 start_codon:yes stop_codon:yes gene_type:complete
MASWKKVIVSGSSAELSALTLDTALPVAQGGIGASSLTDKAVLISQDSGTDAVAALALATNGNIIVGGTSGPAAEAAADVAGTGLTAVTGDGTLAINVDASQTQITSVGTLGTGAISSGFGNIDNGTSTLNTGNATVDNLTNASAVADSHITGSFTGSFAGDGSSLTGVTAAVDIDSLSAAGIGQTDLLIFSDAGTEAKITFSDFEDTIFGAVSGDATVAAGGALTIAADSVEGTMLNTNAADTSTLELSSDTLSVLKVPNALTVDNATIALNSGTTFDGSGAKTISIKDGGVDADALAAAVAGGGLTGGGGSALAVGAGTGVTVNANDIAIGQAIGSGDSPTFTNLTLSGNLTVNGTQTILNTTNLVVEDRFILLNSGSATGDGGLIVQTETGFSGSAFAWDDSAARWGFQIGTKLGDTATAVVPDAYVSSVVTSDVSAYQKNGNIRVESNEIYIYVE